MGSGNEGKAIGGRLSVQTWFRRDLNELESVTNKHSFPFTSPLQILPRNPHSQQASTLPARSHTPIKLPHSQQATKQLSREGGKLGIDLLQNPRGAARSDQGRAYNFPSLSLSFPSLSLSFLLLLSLLPFPFWGRKEKAAICNFFLPQFLGI